MISAHTQLQLKKDFPIFKTFEKHNWETLIQNGIEKKPRAGDVLFDAARPCQLIPFVLSGSVRVTQAGANGRELLLYRVQSGDICLLSLNQAFGNTPATATGIAEEPTHLMLIPIPLFKKLTITENEFHHFIFKFFSSRLIDLMQLVDAIAFQKLDQRLASILQHRGPLLKTTHQQLADELGTAREMVSRLLDRFADTGAIQQSRGRIIIKDATKLSHVSHV